MLTERKSGEVAEAARRAIAPAPTAIDSRYARVLELLVAEKGRGARRSARMPIAGTRSRRVAR